MATTETFARDLGYLDQFFGKLEAHAATLSPTAGARLRTLIGEERARWTEIKALVGGAEPPGAARTSGVAPHVAPPTAAEVAARLPAPARPVVVPRKSEATSLTVGSLIERPR